MPVRFFLDEKEIEALDSLMIDSINVPNEKNGIGVQMCLILMKYMTSKHEFKQVRRVAAEALAIHGGVACVSLVLSVLRHVNLRYSLIGFEIVS